MYLSKCWMLLRLSGLLILVTGCAATHKNVTNLAPDTLQSGRSVAVVYVPDCAEKSVWTERCTEDSEFKFGGNFVASPRGVSRVARNVGVHDELQLAAEKLDVRDVMRTSVAQNFLPLFEANGLNLISETADVRAWNLPQKTKPRIISLRTYFREGSEKDGERQSSLVSRNPNYQSIIESLDTDYLLVIEVLQYGFVRQYTPGISVALEPPTAIAAIRATIYQDNVAESVYDNIVSRSVVPDFDWKIPPEFSALMDLPPVALDAVIADAAKELF